MKRKKKMILSEITPRFKSCYSREVEGMLHAVKHYLEQFDRYNVVSTLSLTSCIEMVFKLLKKNNPAFVIN